MTQFITLAGQKQVGKDTSATMLAEMLARAYVDGVYIIHFADALKKACHVIFGIPLEDMETEEGKQKLTKVRWPDGYHVDTVSYSVNRDGEGVEGVIYYPSDSNPFMTVREVLQFVGTELFRNQIDPDVWLNSVFLQPWAEDDVVIIADARFPNEVALGRENGLLIQVERNTGLVSDGHKSENALGDFTDYHYTIDNNGSFEELKMHLESILIQRRFIINA